MSSSHHKVRAGPNETLSKDAFTN